jgi:hypothetical protein
MKVRIYFNLHKKKLSVQTKINGRWKVVNHVDSAYLEDVQFKVSEAGRQRVLKNKRKNVHAYVCGTLIDTLPLSGRFPSARYNPYQLEKFECENKSIDRAEYVILNGRQLFVYNPS